MIGLDTNVLVRYLTQDDRKQSAKANALIEDELTAQAPGYITSVTIVELVWVLESCYDQSKEGVLDVLHALLTTKQLVVERADMVYLAMRRFSKANADFSDALIAVMSEQEGCSRIVTFDKRAVNVGMELL